jgi:hypothetical protein
LPLQQTISQLKAEQAKSEALRLAAEENARKASLEKAASVKSVFDSVDDESRYDQLTPKQLLDVIADAMDGAFKGYDECSRWPRS